MANVPVYHLLGDHAALLRVTFALLLGLRLAFESCETIGSFAQGFISSLLLLLHLLLLGSGPDGRSDALGNLPYVWDNTLTPDATEAVSLIRLRMMIEKVTDDVSCLA